jgi:hypothetical protein
VDLDILVLKWNISIEDTVASWASCVQ